MDCIPKMNIATPPMKLIMLEYCIAIIVPSVPIINHIITQIKLAIPSFTGFAHLTTPCEASIKFSIFPNIINHINGKYASNNLSPCINNINFIIGIILQ